MIEQIMFLSIGFLAACLKVLLFIPLVHARAVRLTTRRLQDTIPRSATEMQAEKDHLRAVFAMSTRRLEIALQKATTKAAGNLCEIGSKTQEIQLLKTHLGKAASDHKVEIATKTQETQHLLMKLERMSAKYGDEPQSEGDCGKTMIGRTGIDLLADLGKKNKGGASVLRFRTGRKRSPDLSVQKQLAISRQKSSAKWVAFTAASFAIVMLLLLAPGADKQVHRQTALILRGGFAAVPATTFAEHAAVDAQTTQIRMIRRGIKSTDPAMREGEAVPRSAANIVFIRGGRRESLN